MGCMEWGGDYGGGGGYDYTRRSPPPRSSPGASRGYDDHDDDGAGVSSGKSIPRIKLPKSLETDAEAAVVVCCDVTGSMGSWRDIIWKKQPLLYSQITKNYFKGKNTQISYCAIDDAEDFLVPPLQVRPFDSGKSLDERLSEIDINGGGGSNTVESYDLAALYYCRNVSMPKANKPMFIFIGDEGVYDPINPDHARDHANVELAESMSAKQLMNELKSKFSVYLIRKKYDNGSASDDTKIKNQWYSLLGEERVVQLQAPERVVDVILGLVAHEAEMYEDFLGELTSRQTRDQSRTVIDALKSVTMRKGLPGPGDGHSRTRKTTPGKASKPLM